MDPDLRADDLEQAWHDVDLHAGVAKSPDQLEKLSVWIVREGEDDAVDLMLAHERRQVARRAEDGQVAEVLAPLLRLCVDEAEQVETVFRVLLQLPRHELSHVARADDHRLLHVRPGTPRSHAGGYSRRRHAGDDESPEDGQLQQVGICDPG